MRDIHWEVIPSEDHQMARMNKIATAAGTLACALGIGYVMQNTDAATARYGSEAAVKEQELRRLSSENAVLEVEDIVLTSAEFSAAPLEPTLALPDSTPVMLAAASADEPLVRPVSAPISAEAPQSPTAETQTCDISANARPVAGAMVNLTLAAPCMPNERITVHHNGMIFTQTTSEKGTLDITVPALSQDATFVIAFGNGDGAIAEAKIDDLAEFDRVVLQWKGDTGFQMHAREFGSDYDSAGHVWAGTPRSVASAITGEGGFMTVNGDLSAAEPLIAEVYTFPVLTEGQDARVALTVEAEVIKANCGQEIEAQSIELLGDAKIKTQDLSVAVPDCDAVGSFLVLNNLLQDMKVAGH